MKENKLSDNKLFDSELFISSSLRIGVYSAAIIIGIGLLLFFYSGNSGYPQNVFPTSINAVLLGVSLFKPAAIITLGLLVLMATPVFRVGASILLFILEKDYLYTIITLFVFLVLIFSFLTGKSL